MTTNIYTLEKRMDSLEAKMEAGFTDLSSQIESLVISVKYSFDQMVTKDEFNEKMEGVDRRFDRIENISIGGHERRIDNLEDDMRLVKTKVGLKKK